MQEKCRKMQENAGKTQEKKKGGSWGEKTRFAASRVLGNVVTRTGVKLSLGQPLACGVHRTRTLADTASCKTITGKRGS